jgi:DNA-binding CsgD family transcriptional regulator
LCTVAGKSVTNLVPLVEEAALTGLVTATGSLLRFRHDLVRDAIYEDMLEPIRKALHAQAARALAEAGAPPTQIATHAAIGADVGDLQAAAWLRRAAQEVTPRAPLAAIDLLERALELVGDDRSQRNEIRMTLAWSYSANERGDKAAEVARDILAECSDRAIRSAAQRVLFQTLPREDAIVLIDKALSDPTLSPAEQARLVGNKALVLRGSDNALAAAEADRAIALSTAAGDKVGLFLGTYVRAFSYGFEGYFDDAIRLSDELERLAVDVREEESRAVYSEGNRRLLYVWSDRFDEAERQLEAVRSQGPEAGEQQTHFYYWPKSHLEAWAGRWDEAIAVAEAGATLQADPHLAFQYHQLLAYIAVHRDEISKAEMHLRKVPGAAWVPALLAEAKGDSAELERILEDHRRNSIFDPRPWNYAIGLWTLPEWIRLHHATGDIESARVLTEVVEEGARRAGTPTAQGAALRCRGLCEADSETLLASVETYRTGPRPFDLAEACEWAALGRGTKPDEAIVLLEEALMTYESVGAVRDIARAEAHLRRRGVRRGRRGPRRRPLTGWESLTPSEERVTALVAEGLSYREIGDRLFISRRTVETHVVHIFNKLGLASRRELAELARERGLGAHALA